MSYPLRMNRKFPLGALLLTVILLVALLLRIGVGLAFPNSHQPDEIFQSLEQAHRLTYGYGMIPWEFRVGLRSWVFPGILAGVMHLTGWMTEGSSGYLAGVSILLCLLSLTTVLVAFQWGYRIGGLVAAVLSAGICSIWFELVYFAPKAFTEVVASHLLLPGVYLGVHGRCFQPRTRLFLAGCLCGSALALRIHLLPAVLLAMAFSCRKDWRGKWLPMAAGLVGPLLVFGGVDAFTWSYPFQSFWQNVWINVVEGKSLQYGVNPWYGYVAFLVKSWLLGLVPLLILAIVGARRSPILAWLAIVIVLSHSVLSHKEYRFIYPALPMVLILAGLGTAELVRHWRPRWSSPRKMLMPVLVCLVLWTSTSAFLARRYDDPERGFKFPMLWAVPETTNWKRYTGNLLAYRELSTEETLCGVGLLGLSWFISGGYAHLHRDVPIFLFEKETPFNSEQNRNFDQLAPSFNYLVAAIPVPPQQPDYALQKCWGTTCLYKRPGSCASIPGYHVNQVLKQRGE